MVENMNINVVGSLYKLAGLCEIRHLSTLNLYKVLWITLCFFCVWWLTRDSWSISLPPKFCFSNLDNIGHLKTQHRNFYYWPSSQKKNLRGSNILQETWLWVWHFIFVMSSAMLERLICKVTQILCSILYRSILDGKIDTSKKAARNIIVQIIGI